MQFSFDATTVAPDTGEGGGFIPASNDPRGTLVVIVDAGDGNGNLMIANKANNGAFMPLKIKIIEGPDKDKEGIHRLNLQHEKHNAVMSAYAELSAICYVTGVMRINQTIAEIFNKPFRMVSELQDRAKPDGYTQLARGGIRDVNGNKAGKAGTGPQSTGPAPMLNPNNAPQGGGGNFNPNPNPNPNPPQGGGNWGPQGGNGGGGNPNPPQGGGWGGGAPQPGPGPQVETSQPPQWGGGGGAPQGGPQGDPNAGGGGWGGNNPNPNPNQGGNWGGNQGGGGAPGWAS